MENEYVKINRTVYDNLAKEYAFRRDNRSEYSEKPEYLGGALLKHVVSVPNLSVLEIGPGAGQILKFFEDSGCRTIGVELSSNMCAECSKESPKSIIINDNIENIEFYREQFNMIYMGALIHLFPLESAENLMSRIWQWLKPGGCIFINTTCNNSSYEGYYYKDDYSKREKRFRRYWQEEDFQAFVINSGFSIVEKLYTNEIDTQKRWVAFIAKKEG